MRIGATSLTIRFAIPFLQEALQTIKGKVGDGGRDDASNNRAKLAFEFSSRIERALLKGRYGEGFDGAPLQTTGSKQRLATDAGGRNEQGKEGSKIVGGKTNV